MPAFAEWDGTETTKDGTLHIMNPAAPIEPATTVSPREIFRVGGEDEDVLFGVIGSIAIGKDDNIYMLDSQINLVHVFSPDGEYIGEIGREGEGPGEFRGGTDIFVDAEGNIAVIQQMPGKIIRITPGGDALDNFPLPRDGDSTPMQLSSVALAGDDLILSTTDFKMEEGGFSMTRKLVRANADAEIETTYHESTKKNSLASMNYDEVRDAAPLFAASSSGRVYVYDGWDEYAISVYDQTGKLDRVIEREFEPRKRTDEEKEKNKPRAFMQGDNGTREIEAIVSDTDRSIRAMFVRPDGTLWVMNCRGAALQGCDGQVVDAPEGAIAVFDVFDEKGRFIQEVTVNGDGDFETDAFHLIGDRLFVVKAYRSARSAMFASLTGGDDEEEEEEPEALSVICYDLSEIVSAKK